MTPTLGTKLDCLATLDPTDAGFAVDAVNAILTLALVAEPRTFMCNLVQRAGKSFTGGRCAVGRGELPGGGSGDPVARLMVLSGLPTYRSGSPWKDGSLGKASTMGVLRGVVSPCGWGFSDCAWTTRGCVYFDSRDDLKQSTHWVLNRSNGRHFGNCATKRAGLFCSRACRKRQNDNDARCRAKLLLAVRAQCHDD